MGESFDRFLADPFDPSQHPVTGKPDAPEFPEVDLEGLLELQARLNRVDTASPFGSTQFTTDAAGNVTRNFQFSDALQGRFDQAVGGNFRDEIPEVTEALFNRGRDLLDPVFAQQERTLRNRLSNQGLPTNTEAVSGEFGELTRFGQGRNRAFESLARESILGGRQEARAGRQQDFSEFLGLLGGAQGITPQPQPLDVTGPASLSQSSQMAQLQAQMAQQAAKKGGAGDIAAAAPGLIAAFCSRDWKDVEGPMDEARALEIIEDLPVVEFRYNGEMIVDDGPHVSTFAEDFNREVFGEDGQLINLQDYIGVLHAGMKAMAKRISELEAR